MDPTKWFLWATNEVSDVCAGWREALVVTLATDTDLWGRATLSLQSYTEYIKASKHLKANEHVRESSFSSLWVVSDCPPHKVCCWAPWWPSPGLSLVPPPSSLSASAASPVSAPPSSGVPGLYAPPLPGNGGGSGTPLWSLVPGHQSGSGGKVPPFIRRSSCVTGRHKSSRTSTSTDSAYVSLSASLHNSTSCLILLIAWMSFSCNTKKAHRLTED